MLGTAKFVSSMNTCWQYEWWMAELWINFPFHSISVMSGRWKGEYEGLWAMKFSLVRKEFHLQQDSNQRPHGVLTCQPWAFQSKVCHQYFWWCKISLYNKCILIRFSFRAIETVWFVINMKYELENKLSPVAQSHTCPPGIKTVLGLILRSDITSFGENWPWNHSHSHSFTLTDLSRAAVSYWEKAVH